MKRNFYFFGFLIIFIIISLDRHSHSIIAQSKSITSSGVPLYTPFFDRTGVGDYAKYGVSETDNPPDVYRIDATKPEGDIVTFTFEFYNTINIDPSVPTNRIGGFIYLDTDRRIENGFDLSILENHFPCTNPYYTDYDHRGFPLGFEYCMDLFYTSKDVNTGSIFGKLFRFNGETWTQDIEIGIIDDQTINLILPLSLFVDEDNVSGCFHFGCVFDFHPEYLLYPDETSAIFPIDFTPDNQDEYGRNCDLTTIAKDRVADYEEYVYIDDVTLSKVNKPMQLPILYLGVDNKRPFSYYKVEILTYTRADSNFFKQLYSVSPTIRSFDDSIGYTIGDSTFNLEWIPRFPNTFVDSGRGAIAELVFNEEVLNYFIDDTATVIFREFIGTDTSGSLLQNMYGARTYIISHPQQSTNNIISLEQNYPNPIFDGTTITFTVLKENQGVSVRIFNILGQLILSKEISDDLVKPHVYSFHWNASNNEGNRISPGVYILVVSTKDVVKVKKMVVLSKLKD